MTKGLRWQRVCHGTGFATTKGLQWQRVCNGKGFAMAKADGGCGGDASTDRNHSRNSLRQCAGTFLARGLLLFCSLPHLSQSHQVFNFFPHIFSLYAAAGKSWRSFPHIFTPQPWGIKPPRCRTLISASALRSLFSLVIHRFASLTALEFSLSIQSGKIVLFRLTSHQHHEAVQTAVHYCKP
jgi:hypothetical protein